MALLLTILSCPISLTQLFAGIMNFMIIETIQTMKNVYQIQTLLSVQVYTKIQKEPKHLRAGCTNHT